MNSGHEDGICEEEIQHGEGHVEAVLCKNSKVYPHTTFNLLTTLPTFLILHFYLHTLFPLLCLLLTILFSSLLCLVLLLRILFLFSSPSPSSPPPTHHYGVDVALVSSEGLYTVAAPDVPQFRRGIAGPRDKCLLVRGEGQGHHVACMPGERRHLDEAVLASVRRGRLPAGRSQCPTARTTCRR